MPKLKAEPGQVKETVIQERVINDPDSKLGGDNEELVGDVFEVVARIPADERDEWICYVYRDRPEKQNGYISKMVPPFDEETVKENFGGGEYRLMLKKNSEIKKRTTFTVNGEPKTEIPAVVASVPGAGTVSKSDLQAVVEMIMKNNPANNSNEIMKTSFLNALEVQKAAMMSAQMGPGALVDVMKNMHSMVMPPAASSGIPEWAQPFVAAAIPALLSLFTEVLKPKDMISQLTSAAQAMEALKGISGGGGREKPDYLGALINNGPQLLGKASEILGELRKATELRVQAQVAQLPAGPIRVAANPSLHTPPPPQVEPILPSPRVALITPPPVPPVSVSAGTQDGAPDPQWVLGKVAEMIAKSDDPGFVLDFLDENLPELVAAMRMLTIEAIAEHMASVPQFVQVVALPHFPDFLKSFYEKLREPPAAQPLAN